MSDDKTTDQSAAPREDDTAPGVQGSDRAFGTAPSFGFGALGSDRALGRSPALAGSRDRDGD